MLVSVLEKSGVRDYTAIVLQTLSALVHKSPIYLSDHVDLLLVYARMPQSLHIQKMALNHLYYLSMNNHLWSISQVEVNSSLFFLFPFFFLFKYISAEESNLFFFSLSFFPIFGHLLLIFEFCRLYFWHLNHHLKLLTHYLFVYFWLFQRIH